MNQQITSEQDKHLFVTNGVVKKDQQVIRICLKMTKLVIG